MSTYTDSAGNRRAVTAAVLAAITIALYAAAGTIDDSLYLLTGLVGLAAALLGVRARREGGGWPATVAIAIGGLAAVAVGIAFVAWSVSKLV